MNTKDTVATLFVVGIAAISLVIAMGLLVPFLPSGQQEAVAQQNDTTTTTTTTTNQSIMPASSNKTFSLFNIEVEGGNETYIYSLPVIVANRGDSVTVQLFNIAETEEEGTFPYYCKYHPQTMVGQLVVLPLQSPGASSPSAT